ncbi:hypothetical protein ASE63_20260 [Bosea sp. Root381]|uniref:DksA/TraR family C4-type zinc finger protein n=1 Tax=Bosea sp. Root381 TaxID=1736524 RepID=UPI0006F5E204|nr:DksA/TraR family C4-type zinc finger protein [Bosea sp. Root381]KRE11293.1 hypothetical protein ASE63_20260 [Bosea sp. Root381]
MASGWAPDGAVQDQIDVSVADAVQLARSRLPTGPGEIHCQECGEEIAEGRRKAMPGARLCITCQSGHDRPASASSYNRRGSKDSQLR